MPFAKKSETENGIAGIWELTDSVEQLRKNFNFTRNEKTEFGQLKNEKRKKEYLAVRLLTEKLLDKKPDIHYRKAGNPYLKNHTLNISISHSAELITVFLSEKIAGIDAENIFRNTEKITRRFLSDSEFKTTTQSNNRQLAFVMYWSAKEAIFKCASVQNVNFKNQIRVFPFSIKNEGQLRGSLKTEKDFRNFDLWYFFYGNNVIVYCVEE